MAIEQKKLDQNDRNILKALQQDASLSLENLAAKLSLSTNACWRRIKRMEADGIIDRRVAIVEPEAVGLGMTALLRSRPMTIATNGLEKFASSSLVYRGDSRILPDGRRSRLYDQAARPRHVRL